MTTTTASTEPQRRAPWKWGVFFAGVWLLYLTDAFEAGWDRGGLRGWTGMVAIIAFAVVYLAVFIRVRMSRQFEGPFVAADSVPLGLSAVTLQVLLAIVVCACVGQTGTATSVFVAVMAIICLPRRWGWVIAVAVALTTYAATASLPGWHRDSGILFGTLVATLAMWGITTAINRNIEVLAVREENARLAVEDERNRFARDLHDILGHSLTVITVKAELANRLFDADPDRARSEIEDLERLSRDALVDVRRAVEGYRELTLPGEIARARMALEAAQISADLPNSTDDIPTELRELFAWTVREGVTNVIRHSRAQSCTVRLTPASAEVVDDGRGAAGGTPGNGLLGLRERAATVGAEVSAAPVAGGFALRVTVA